MLAERLPTGRIGRTAIRRNDGANDQLGAQLTGNFDRRAILESRQTEMRRRHGKAMLGHEALERRKIGVEAAIAFHMRVSRFGSGSENIRQRKIASAIKLKANIQ